MRINMMCLILLACLIGCRQDPESWVAVRDVSVAEKANVAVVAVNYLTDADTMGQALIYDLKTNKKLHSFGKYHDWLWALDISADGKMVVTASYDQGIHIWAIGDGVKMKYRIGSVSCQYLDVSLSPDSKLVASGDWEGNLILWDAMTGKHVVSFPRLGRAVDAVKFSSDGKFLAATASGEIVLVDVKQKKIVKSIKAHSPFQTNGLAFSHDGTLLASAGLDMSVCVRETKTLKLLTKLKSSDPVQGLAFSRDDNSLICGGENKQLFVWEFRKKTETINTLEGHENAVYAVDVSPDGKTFLSCAHDQTVRVWDLKSKNELLKIHPTVNFGKRK